MSRENTQDYCMYTNTISHINFFILLNFFFFFSVDFNDLSIPLILHVLLFSNLYLNVMTVIKKELRFYEFKL